MPTAVAVTSSDLALPALDRQTPPAVVLRAPEAQPLDEAWEETQALLHHHGHLVVLYSAVCPPRHVRRLHALRTLADSARMAIVPLDLPPLAVAVLARQLRELSPYGISPGVLACSARLLAHYVHTGAVLGSLSGLDRLDVDLRAHLRSWLPGSSFVALAHPEPHLVPLDRGHPPEALPAPGHAVSLTLARGQSHSDWVRTDLGRVWQAYTTHEVPLPVESTAWWGTNKLVEFVAALPDLSVLHQLVTSVRREECGWCGAELIGDHCAFCATPVPREDEPHPPAPEPKRSAPATRPPRPDQEATAPGGAPAPHPAEPSWPGVAQPVAVPQGAFGPWTGATDTPPATSFPAGHGEGGDRYVANGSAGPGSRSPWDGTAPGQHGAAGGQHGAAGGQDGVNGRGRQQPTGEWPGSAPRPAEGSTWPAPAGRPADSAASAATAVAPAADVTPVGPAASAGAAVSLAPTGPDGPTGPSGLDGSDRPGGPAGAQGPGAPTGPTVLGSALEHRGLSPVAPTGVPTGQVPLPPPAAALPAPLPPAADPAGPSPLAAPPPPTAPAAPPFPQTTEAATPPPTPAYPAPPRPTTADTPGAADAPRTAATAPRADATPEARALRKPATSPGTPLPAPPGAVEPAAAAEADGPPAAAQGGAAGTPRRALRTPFAVPTTFDGGPGVKADPAAARHVPPYAPSFTSRHAPLPAGHRGQQKQTHPPDTPHSPGPARELPEAAAPEPPGPATQPRALHLPTAPRGPAEGLRARQTPGRGDTPR
ncbi:hypothetical protein ACFV3R_20610 [Streptomyces sp. NPDC059740]|uniref:hypothetical protein n=1 Tax=Streptomyces sp. NPDC059740 TaxID=3346926 RepID=UPI00364B09D8